MTYPENPGLRLEIAIAKSAGLLKLIAPAVGELVRSGEPGRGGEEAEFGTEALIRDVCREMHDAFNCVFEYAAGRPAPAPSER